MTTQNARQTNALLGYPADARLLLVNADDLGMCHAVNDAIIHSLQEGIVTSTSVMVPCPWALHAITWLKQAPSVPFGVHLTVISEQPTYRWGPVLCRSEVPSLLDEMGYFYSEARIDELISRVNLAELEREFRAQIEWVLAAGLRAADRSRIRFANVAPPLKEALVSFGVAFEAEAPRTVAEAKPA